MIASNVPQNLYDYFHQIYWTKKLGRSPRTKRIYEGVIDRLRDYLSASRGDESRTETTPTLASLTEETLAGFLSHRLESCAPHTVDKERDKLVAIVNFASKRGHIVYFDVPAVSPPQSVPVAWRREHVTMLLDACRSSQGFIDRIPAGEWWLMFHYFFLLIGERTEATLEVRWEWDHRDAIVVPADVRKGRRKPMVYRVPKFLREKLDKFRALTVKIYGKAEGAIFRHPWSRSHKTGAFYRRYERLLQRAGLPHTREWKPQCLRRTFASYLKLAGGDPRKALGHTTERITEESYLDPVITDAKKTADGELVAKQLGFI